MLEITDQDQTTAQEKQTARPMSSAPQSVSAGSTGDSDAPVRDDASIIKAGLAAVEEWEAEHGPLSDEVLAWADKILDDALGSPEKPSGR